MLIDDRTIMSVTEANQNFSSVARAADKDGAVVLMENNRPAYLLVRYDHLTGETVSDETVKDIARSIVLQYADGFRALAR